jgi:hypothetical protein
VASESARGWKLDKLKQRDRIDAAVALAMACLAAVEGQSTYDDTLSWVMSPEDDAAFERTLMRTAYF